MFLVSPTCKSCFPNSIPTKLRDAKRAPTAASLFADLVFNSLPYISGPTCMAVPNLKKGIVMLIVVAIAPEKSQQWNN